MPRVAVLAALIALAGCRDQAPRIRLEQRDAQTSACQESCLAERTACGQLTQEGEAALLPPELAQARLAERMAAAGRLSEKCADEHRRCLARCRQVEDPL